MFSGVRRRGHLKHVMRAPGMLSPGEAHALYCFARAADRGCIVEVGSYRGRSTVALALGTRDGHDLPVYAVDPHEDFVGVKGGQFGPEDRGQFYRTMLSTGTYRQVRLLNTSSEVLSPGWRHEVSLLWIDGDHRLEAVRRDFDSWRPHLSKGAVVVLDDVDVVEGGPNILSRSLVEARTAEVVLEIGKLRAVQMSYH